jgi:hypothetical protein
VATVTNEVVLGVVLEVMFGAYLVVGLGIVLGVTLEVMMGLDESNLTKSIFPLASLPLQVRTEKIRKPENHRLT